MGVFRSDQFRRLSKEGSWIVLGQAMAVLGSLVCVRVLTGLLTTSEYGELALGMTLATLVGQTLLGPLGQGATRFYAPAVEKSALNVYLNVVRRLVFSATGIVFLIVLFTSAGLLLIGRIEWVGIAIASFIFAILAGHNDILNGIQNAARQRSVVALHRGAESWTRFLAAAGLIFLLGASSTVAILGYGLSMVFVLFSQYIFFRPIIASAGDDDLTEPTYFSQWQERILAYSWPFVSWGIFTWAQQASDRWALALLDSTQEVGLYAVLFQLGYYPISILTGIFLQLVSPILFERIGDATDVKRVIQVSRINNMLAGFTLGLTLVAFLLVFVLHHLVFEIFVARQYASVSYMLPWIVLSGGIFASAQVMSLGLMNKLNTRGLIAPKIITAIIAVLLNFTGAYLWGVKGVVAGGLSFSATFWIWMFIQSRRTNVEFSYNSG